MFENDYLMHYGIKGQKWGVRRYQNADGSLTTAGRARYSKGSGKRARYGSSLAAMTALSMAPVAGLVGYSVAQKITADKQSAKNVMYELERSGALKGLTADQIKKVEKEVKGSVRRNSNSSPVYSTEASARTAGERVANTYKGKKPKYGSENTMDPNKAARVEKLNKKIDKLNLKMQKGTARSYGYGDLSVGKQAALAGGLGAGIGGAAMYNTASKAAKAYNNLNANPIVKGYQFTTDAGGNTIMVPSVVAGASKINPVAAGLKAAIPYATAVGLTNAAGGAILGAAAKGFGSHDIFRKGREQKIKKLQYERDALDSSQKNRKGRILTQEEFNKQFNGAKGGVTGLNLGGLAGGAVGAAIGKRSKRDNAYEYEQYKKNAVAYGSKKKNEMSYRDIGAEEYPSWIKAKDSGKTWYPTTMSKNTIKPKQYFTKDKKPYLTKDEYDSWAYELLGVDENEARKVLAERDYYYPSNGSKKRR